MSPTAVIALFDVGKTNKKVLLFDELYQPVWEETTQLEETIDEDGFPCEDVDALTKWIRQKFAEILERKDVEVKAVNFSGYGASLVHLDRFNKPITPLYNYLKPYPESLKKQFYDGYGGESLISKQTATPVLGSLNSGLQLYRLKYEKPNLYTQIKHSLHLPQYLSFLLSGNVAADLSSVGCHTHLWDFNRNNYHGWVYKEALDKKLPPLYKGDRVIGVYDRGKIKVGIGLHDSSAALIPYLSSFREPFILLSTGTWCISLNPFPGQQPDQKAMLSDYELQNDCLCYLTYQGVPVKASRLFAGHEHEQQIKKLAIHFHKKTDYYKSVLYDATLLNHLDLNEWQPVGNPALGQKTAFAQRDLNGFTTYEAAYHQLLFDIVSQQVKATRLVCQETPVKRIFVDGGFCTNPVYMNLLARAFQHMEVYAATVAQASALGAALAIHSHWNHHPLPPDILELKYYAVRK